MINTSSTGSHRNCPMCRKKIEIHSEDVYERKPGGTFCKMETQMNLCTMIIFVRIILTILRLGLFCTILYLLAGLLHYNRTQRAVIILCHIISVFIPYGINWFIRTLCDDPGCDGLPDSTVTQHKFNDASDCFCGISLTPDEKFLYFRPLSFKKCTGRYVNTKLNWLKLYIYQMLMYVYIQAFLNLAWALLATYNYIEFPIHLALQLTTWALLTLPCFFSGDNYCNKMKFEKQTVRTIQTKQGCKVIPNK